MKKFVIVRPNDTIEVLILKNKNDNTYSFVNLTKSHICPCRFRTIEDAIKDIDKLKEQGKIIMYKEII